MTMREILFRGKRVDNDEWVFGSFCMDALELKNGPCGVDGFIRLYDFADRRMQTYEVDRETVGQYVGKTDRTGGRIFDGDICRFLNDDGEYTDSLVYWDDTQSQWRIRAVEYRDTDELDAFYGERCEIIGNQWDNPELLEVK